MSFQKEFANLPILAWVIDDWEQFYAALKEQDRSFNLTQYLSYYKQTSYKNIDKLFENAPFKLNLGGETEKTKLVKTDKPMGVFDFSLASSGLYKLMEYYSAELALKFPDLFESFELPKGVVPPNLVLDETVDGKKIFFYIHEGERFDCVVQQKGTAAVDEGVQGARKEFATKNRKVFLTYKRNKGKVRYVEIYTLFYYTSLNGDLQMAVRHIPVLMLAEYLESVGIKTRVYMTRFVKLATPRLRTDTSDGVKLPMTEEFNKITNQRSGSLFLQPIIAKDFGEEMDKALALMISSDKNDVYDLLAKNSIAKECTNSMSVYGDPDWEQIEYQEGFDRYRNKYNQYVKLGLFKSKEVLPEAMLFFHDMLIKLKFNRWINKLSEFFPGLSEADRLIDVNVNHFFNWWMRLSANTLRNKVEILNSKELRKDLAAMQIRVNDLALELGNIVANIDDTIENNSGKKFKKYIKEFGNQLIGPTIVTRGSSTEYGYDLIDSKGNLTFVRYVEKITSELTTYAEGELYETPTDLQDKMNLLLQDVLTELENFK